MTMAPLTISSPSSFSGFISKVSGSTIFTQTPVSGGPMLPRLATLTPRSASDAGTLMETMGDSSVLPNPSAMTSPVIS